MSTHGREPVCVLCGYCRRSGHTECCDACGRIAHYLCLDSTVRAFDHAGHCEDCGVSFSNQKAQRLMQQDDRKIEPCPCVQPFLRSSSSYDDSHSSHSSTDTAHNTDAQISNTRTVDHSETCARSTSKVDQTKSSECRRSQQVPTKGPVNMPDKVAVTLEYCKRLREEPELDVEEYEEDNESGIYQEALFEIKDNVKYSDKGGEEVSGTVIGRILNPRFTSDFDEGDNITLLCRPGWKYTVKRNCGGNAESVKTLECESDLDFDTGDDHGTASDEEEYKDVEE